MILINLIKPSTFQVTTIDKKISDLIESKNINKIMGLVATSDQIIFHFHYHGNHFSKPFTALENLNEIDYKGDAFLFPLDFELAKFMKDCLLQYPHKRYYSICESALFRTRSDSQKTYALPDPANSKYEKIGADSFFIDWLFSHTNPFLSKDKKMLAIHLSETPLISGLDQQNPVYSSYGISYLSGIPSINACGDIDPALIPDLIEAGDSPDKIKQELLENSGFSAIYSKTISEILKSESDSEASKYLLHHIILKIGEAVALMGGVDTIVIANKNIRHAKPFIERLLSKLEFLCGPLCYPAPTEERIMSFSQTSSDTTVIGLDYQTADHIRSLLIH
jgi:acetate kinase